MLNHFSWNELQYLNLIIYACRNIYSNEITLITKMEQLLFNAIHNFFKIL